MRPPMRTESLPSRSASLLAAATTVVALMACAQHVGPVDGRLASTREPAGARVMAVVLAAARDLLLPERTPSTVRAPLGPDELVPTAARPLAHADVVPFVPPQPPLGDRWPDLPPPTC